jgi:hypothetical protein
MLKKHNKLVVFLVLAAFMFTMVGSASAATFTDVSGNGVEASAIYKLTSLGIIDGYPDGTFGAEKTITRAEFAKIAVYMAGMQAVANGMQGTPSSFKDVSSDFWANGWINVAAAQGFVKGYPDGTFKPQAQITQAEVITVLLRLLGYNDNLPGVWPANYIAKAANLGILDDITFLANAAATRGTVAILGADTLDQNVMVYEASNNLFKQATKDDGTGTMVAYTLLKDSFDDADTTEDVLVKEMEKADGVYTMTTFDPVKGADVDIELDKNCVVSGATKLGLIGKFVDYTLNDDGKAIFVSVKDYPVVTTTKVEITSANSKIKTKEGKTYSFINTFANVYMRNLNAGTDAGLIAGNVGVYENANVYTLTLNEDGKVAMLSGASAPQGGIVDSVGSEKIFFKDNASPMVVSVPVSQGVNVDYVATSNYTDKDIIVQKDGKEVELSDISEGDAVWVYSGALALGADYMILASSKTVECELQSIEATAGAVTKIKTDKGDYKVVSGSPLLSVDGGEKFQAGGMTDTMVDKYDLYGTDVTLVMSATGRVAAVISNAKDKESSIYGLVTKVNNAPIYVANEQCYMVTVLRADGEEYDYPVYDDSKIDDVKVGALPAAIAGLQDKLIGVDLDSDGLVKNIERTGLNTPSGAVTVNTDLNSLSFGGKFYAAKDIVIYNINTTGGVADPVVVKWSEFKDSPVALLGYYVDGTDIEYAVIDDNTVGSSTNYAVVMGKGKNKDGDYVNILIGDETIESYEVNAGMANIGAKGSIVEYKLSGGKLTANFFTPAAAVNVTKIDTPNNIIEIAGTGYLFDEDTRFFDTYDTDNPKGITAKDIARGEKVSFLDDGTGLLLYVTIVK